MRAAWQELATAYRFALVGLAATAAHLALAALVLTVVPQISVFAANVLAFLGAFCISLGGHRRYTFRRRGSAQRFFLVALLGFSLNNGLLAGMVAATPVTGFAAIALATLAVPLITYIAARLWAFAGEGIAGNPAQRR